MSKLSSINELNIYEIENPTIGCDIEFVIIDQDTNVVSAIETVPGTKEEPHPIGNGCFIHNDNVMVEFSMPPSKNVEEFVGYLHYCEQFGSSFLRNNSPEDKEYELLGCTSVEFPESELEKQGSKEFGCSVSFNAYTGKTMRPSAKKAGNMRTAGYHLHVGFKQKGEDISIDQIQMLIRTLDLFVTLPSVVFDNDTSRRSLYGKAGDHRYREIDDILIVELRTLGNNLFQDSGLVTYSFNQLMRGINFFNTCVKEGFASVIEDSSEIQRIINNHDVDAAIEMCKKYDIELPLVEVGFNSLNYKNKETNKIININKNKNERKTASYPGEWDDVFGSESGFGRYATDFREDY